MFGADVIARVHGDRDVRPFFHHELFHLLHGRTFSDCGALWCALWNEGLATFVAHRLNPAASDDQLLLTQPVPLRAAVEARETGRTTGQTLLESGVVTPESMVRMWATCW